MPRFHLLVWSVAAMVLIASPPAGAAPDVPDAKAAAPPDEKKAGPSFALVPVGKEGHFGEPSYSRSNRHGTAIGTLSTRVGDDIRHEPFICIRGGDPTALTAPAGFGPDFTVSVEDLNDNDWAIGSMSAAWRRGPGEPASPFRTTVVVWIPGKGAADIGRLPGHRRAMPTGINNRNQVVGHSSGDRGGRHAFLWEEGKGMRDLGDLPNGRGNVTAGAVNELGHVVGGAGVVAAPGEREVGHPFLWTPENGMTDLGVFPGGGGASAFAVNDRDEVVGFGQTAEVSHRAFRWTKEGGMVELGSVRGWPTSIAYGINNAGWVVGRCRGPNFGGRADAGRGFLWTPDAGLRDLNDLLEPESGKGWEITGAGRVNDLGEIEASGKKDGASYRVRLVPKVPLPVKPPA